MLKIENNDEYTLIDTNNFINLYHPEENSYKPYTHFVNKNKFYY